MAVREKVWTKGDTVSIPVSFGIFVKGDSKRYTTGFVEATFLEYTQEGLANIRLGTDTFTVSKAQLIQQSVDMAYEQYRCLFCNVVLDPKHDSVAELVTGWVIKGRFVKQTERTWRFAHKVCVDYKPVDDSQGNLF